MKSRPPLRPEGTAEHPLIAQAVGLHQAGRLREAAALYEQIIAQQPRHFDAAHLRGVIALQEGNYEEAERRIRAALQWNPDDVAALGNLGTALLRAGKSEAAHKNFERTTRLQPNSEVPWGNLGAVLRQMGRSEEALAPLRRAHAINAGSEMVCNLLGACLMDTGDAQGAIAAFEAATVAAPANVDGWANLAAALLKSGDADAAMQTARKAVAMQPQSSSAHAVLASVQTEKGQLAEALATYRQAAALPLPSTQTLGAYGLALMRSGDYVAARGALARAIEADSNNATARWALAIAWCEAIYADAAAIETSRAAFAEALGDLRTWFEVARRPDAWFAVGTSQPFHLAYQPFYNKDLLSRYGELCVEWMASMPSEKVHAVRGARPNQRKLRIGFAAAHIRDQSVWNAITKGWVEQLDRTKFDVHLFQLERTSDAQTELARQCASRFVDQPRNLPEWIAAIRAADLDALIFPEIGMDALTLQLASLRLAPVQAATWGHPQTTGLPTMDLYFSGADLEPVDGERNYSERLVRLPGLGVYVDPLSPQIPDLDLREFGLPTDEPLLLCPGAPFKYSPLHDRVWARIAAGLHSADGGWLVFFRSRSQIMDDMVERRMRAAFEREGVDFDAHVCVLPALSRPKYFALMRRAALMLDTLGFSGFNTALQAAECGLPYLAHEGKYLCARLASGIMRRLELAELVTTTEQEFIASAVRLAGDVPARARLRQQIELRRGVLFRDEEPVRALERCLSDAIAAAKSGRNRNRTSWD